MEKFQNTLIRFGTFASQNKYLSSIKNAFQQFVPFTIIGAIGVLWSNVICNSTTGLGSIYPPIMGLSFLNPAFDAINFCTIGCIALGITFLVGSEIAEHNKQSATFCGLLAVIALVSISSTTTNVYDSQNQLLQSVSGIFANSLGSKGIFTGMFIAIFAIELFSCFFKFEFLKIKLPEQVPTGVSKSFEYLVPALLTLFVTSLLNLAVVHFTGAYINDLIFNLIQTPLLKIGGSLPGILLFIAISCMFWSVGLHGDNMIGGVLEPILITLMLENTAAVEAQQVATHIINYSFYRTFMATGGTGMMLSLTIALFLFSKREENKSIATISFIPNLFNIGEVNMFGVPVVLNPLLIIPFIIAPLVGICIGYLLTILHICPVMFIQLPWTMPPFLMGFLASGGSIMGGICQLIAVAACTFIYLPFIKMYEKQQNMLEE